MSSMTLEEALAASVVRTAIPGTEPHIIINADRSVIVPDELINIAVQHDHNIESVTFDCPRYWDEHDMSQMHVYVNYMREDGYKDGFLCTNVEPDPADETLMHFVWTISKNVTKVKGKLVFLVCIKKSDSEGNEINHWNSQLCSDMKILEGMECTEQVVEQNPDIIEQILVRLDNVTEIPQEKVAEAVESYMEANPFEETDPTVPEWAKNPQKPSYTAEEVGARPEIWIPTAQEVGALPANTKIPSKTSDLQNDSGFQTGTQVQSTVNTAIAGITHFHFLKVTELPATGEENIIYLLPRTQSENDNYDEYLYVDGAWELIGNTDIDLSGYALKEEIPTVPDVLPNPKKLSINVGGTVVEYDGSGAVIVTVPDSEGGAIERIEKGSTDMVVELQPNKLYIFPEMSTLTYTLAAGDTGVVNEYHFLFQSGATPTEVVHPAGVNVGSLTVEANKIYEISVLEGMLTSQSWAV